MPIGVVHGFSSQTFLHDIVMKIVAAKKPAFIYYFGDCDPSRILGQKAADRFVRDSAPRAEIYFERLAVMREQISEYRLETSVRETKDSTHARSEYWDGGDSVEVDAMPATALSTMFRTAVQSKLDPKRYAATLRRKRRERKRLRDWISQHSE